MLSYYNSVLFLDSLLKAWLLITISVIMFGYIIIVFGLKKVYVGEIVFWYNKKLRMEDTQSSSEYESGNPNNVNNDDDDDGQEKHKRFIRYLKYIVVSVVVIGIVGFGLYKYFSLSDGLYIAPSLEAFLFDQQLGVLLQNHGPTLKGMLLKGDAYNEARLPQIILELLLKNKEYILSNFVEVPLTQENLTSFTTDFREFCRPLNGLFDLTYKGYTSVVKIDNLD